VLFDICVYTLIGITITQTVGCLRSKPRGTHEMVVLLSLAVWARIAEYVYMH
jgi:hypothetical protein